MPNGLMNKIVNYTVTTLELDIGSTDKSTLQRFIHHSFLLGNSEMYRQTANTKKTYLTIKRHEFISQPSPKLYLLPITSLQY